MDYLRGKDFEQHWFAEKTQRRALALHTNTKPTCPRHHAIAGYEPRLDAILENADHDYLYPQNSEMWFCPVCKEYFVYQDKKKKIRPLVWLRPEFAGVNKKVLELRDKLTAIKLLQRQVTGND